MIGRRRHYPPPPGRDLPSSSRARQKRRTPHERVALRLLLLEDSGDDILLLLRELWRGGYDPIYEVADTPQKMERALKEADGRGEPWEMVISDYYMPDFRATDALRLMQKLGYDIPFIVVSSKLGEEAAVAIMRAGARDYVSKESLWRLGTVIDRELREAEERLERKHAEEEIRLRDRAIEASPNGIILTDPNLPDNPIVYVNPAFERITGYSAEEVLGRNGGFLEGDDREQPALEELYSALREQRGCQVVLRNYRKDGTLFWNELSVSPIYDDEGRLTHFIAVQTDITERVRAQEKLKESEELYRAVVEQATEGIFLVDVQTMSILEFNAAFRSLLGYPEEEIREMRLYEIVAHDPESVDRQMKRIMEQGANFIGERRYRRRDGSLVDVEVSASRISYGGREAVCAVVRDVTARRDAENELRRNLSVLLALREAGQILGSTLKAEEIASRLLEIMKNVLDLTATVISVREEDGQLHIWRSAGLRNLWPRARFSPEAEAARRTVLESGEHRVFRLSSPDPSAEDITGLCLPLRTRDRTIGVLEAYGPGSLAENEALEILLSLTNQAASALENAQLYGELAERERRLQDLITRLLRAQEEERRRVAYEVHDELAQVAVAAHQHLQAFARRYPPDTESSKNDLQRVLRLVRRTVSDARRIIANLRPTALDDLGLGPAITLEVDRLRQEGYEIDYTEKLGEERLPSSVEITLFRIVQEALTNVHKHAQTRWVRVALYDLGDEARLEVQDYGRGFDPDAASTGSGPGERVGLAGMQERVSALGGKLEIRSRPGIGTCIVVAVPLSTPD